jgi:hypothetical protein
LETQADYENRIQALLDTCNTQIEELEACAKQASREPRTQYDEEISVLIANREALKRGMLKLDEQSRLALQRMQETKREGLL